MKKRLLSLLLALCLLLSVSPAALAAPTRDIQRTEIIQDLNLTALVELVLGAAVMQDVPALEAGVTPPQALVEGVFALGLFNMTLPYGGNGLLEGTPTLPLEQLESYYDIVFTQGEYTKIAQAFSPCITVQGDQLHFQLDSLMENPSVGAHIYSSYFDGEVVTLLCDLFTYYDEYGQMAEYLPEDALTWLCNAKVQLQYAPDMPFGFTVSGYTLSDVYLDGMTYDWQNIENTEFEYSVLLPSILGLADDDPRHMAWQTADGEVNVIIDVVDMAQVSYDDVYAQYKRAHPQDQVTQEKDFFTFYGESEGCYTLCVVPEGLNWVYMVTMTFPASRQAEFMLYGEIIRNSMTVWGLSNG